MKKVLLITYHFPPGSAVGGVRTAKFAKYLPQFGWKPIVLTVRNKFNSEQETMHPETDFKLPMVARTRMLNSPSYYHRTLKYLLHCNQRGSNITHPVSSSNSNAGGSNLRQLISWLLSFPDEQVGWLPFALVTGLNLVRTERITVIMTSGPPHSVHLIGACLNKLTGLPWIADFRDPYYKTHLNQKNLEATVPQRLTRRLETWFVRRAAIVLTTTQRLTECLQARYSVHKEKVFTLPNGYDPEDYAGIRKGKENRFVISYLGTFYRNRNPEPLLRAIRELIAERKIDPTKVLVRFVGYQNENAERSAMELVRQYGLSGIVDISSWLPRRRALEIMVQSHVLLLLAEDQPLQIPAKVYDYIGADSEILAVTGEGATSDLLREVGVGIVIPPDNNPVLKTAIKTNYQRYLNSMNQRKDCFLGKNSLPTKFNRRHLTRELAAHLDQTRQAYNLTTTVTGSEK